MENENTRVKTTKNDFTKGPVRIERQVNGKTIVHFVCDFRLPDGRRRIKKCRRERQAWAWWKREMRKIDEGTWDRASTPKKMILGQAADLFRPWAHANYDSNSWESNLRFWE